MKKTIGFLFAFCLFVSTYSFTQSLIINEIHADPDATNGDANGDGVISSDDDEFVELINTTVSDLDISNWTLSDGIGLRHTFSNPTIIPSSQSIVVFGGGTPTNIPGVVQMTGTLGLNNDGDIVVIKDLASTIIDSYTYTASEGGDNQSLARSPDITGSFVKHTTISGNPVRFSPGRDNTDNSPLPIELSSFTASSKGKEIHLNWTTKTEVSNYGFEIERSITPTPSQREGTFS
jgi:trimeric autotransporter adhesin